MKTIYRVSLASLLICGFLAVSNVAFATDRPSNHDKSGQHRLLSAELRAKLERVKDKLKDYREQHHNRGGYSGSLEALQAEVASLKTQLATLADAEALLLSQLSNLSSRLSALETGGGTGGSSPALTELARYVTVDPNPINGLKGPHVIFSGVNLHVRSGSGSTGDSGVPMGLGNLIIGYNEGPHPDPTSSRNGSHNIVGGTLNAFTATGGLVLGAQNWIQGDFSSILGGQNNLAQGLGSSILGGRANFTGSSNQTVP